MKLNTEFFISGSLVSAPVWQLYLADVSFIASAIAAICGAIIGVHAVYRIIKKYR